jgi:hypothetical protein
VTLRFKRTLKAKFYCPEILSGAIIGVLTFSSLDLTESQTEILHTALYLACAPVVAVGFLLHERESLVQQNVGLFLIKIALNIFGFFLVLV